MRNTLTALALVLLSTVLYAAKPPLDGPLPSADEFTMLTGKVTISTVNDHMVGVVVDNGGQFLHLFRLWTGAAVTPFHATSQSASIEYRGDELVLMAADQDWFYALVTSTADSRSFRQPTGYTGARYVGYGLNHEIRPLASRMPNSRRVIRPLDCTDDDSCLVNLDYGIGGGGGASCDSGGPNSSSCSISNTHGSCSVACTYGYACCTNATATSNASCQCKTQ
jgi:hypothetical protein